MAHGGRREGSGRRVSSIPTIVSRLPEGLGERLFFEIKVALQRVFRADPQQQRDMANAMIAALQGVPMVGPAGEPSGNLTK